MTNRQFVLSIYPTAIIKKFYPSQDWKMPYWLVYKSKEDKDQIASGNSTVEAWKHAKYTIEVLKLK